ncbi:Release factor glutamine methyltransferase [Halomicronema hongdechloris C2206]|uniref:Release factor glutamine methyltransferase n=1 Tax=Halomicronema hongdechloris C2206 TaxID=1641165 RepID=A0A1Z3HRK8_9CYAN|nr:peptide chain release factor N(5)-glutamine methyltransferase [Halomicronema hongdechloris]ASC72953.1 Release factor glutamine methyltransferase [Halomicronema hongdechloris C2206]
MSRTEGAHTITGSELWQWWQMARQQALAQQIDPAEVDWLVRAISDVDGLSLRLQSFRQRAAIPCRYGLPALETLWQRRRQEHIPVQYLVGQTQWRDFTLQVSTAVLIPRPETELLIELVHAAVAQTPALEAGTWVDLGTGSGAIALGLAKALPRAHIIAVDCSAEALALAAANAAANGLCDRIELRQGHWFTPLADLRGQLAGMVANPPYIPSAMVATLAPEVAVHEPRLALDGGPDGLTAIQHLIDAAPDYLQANGLWLIEAMAGQPATILQQLQQHGAYCDLQRHRDLAGLERFVQARCQGPQGSRRHSQ